MIQFSKFFCVGIFTAALALSARAGDPPVLAAESNRPNTSTYAAGEPVEITFTASGMPAGTHTTLTIDVHDEYGKPVVSAMSAPLTADASGSSYYIYAAPSARLGYYEVTARLSDGTTIAPLGTRPPGIVTYAVVPDPAKRHDYGSERSRFGMQGGFNTQANVMPYLGVRYVLVGDSWAEREPKYPGQFAEERKAAQEAGKRLPEINPAIQSMSFGGKPWQTYAIATVTKASLPAWAIKEGTSGTTCKTFGSLNEQGASSLAEFANALASEFSWDYKNQKTHWYQVTWEPGNRWCYGGDPAGLVKIYSLAYEGLHHADPSAIVAGPTLFIGDDSTQQLAELLDAGLGKHIDAFCVHPYTYHWPPETNGLPSILREELKLVNMAVGHKVPFIGTEHGYTSADSGSLAKAMGDIRSTLIMLGEGASFDYGFYVADFWDGDDPQKSKGYGYYWNLNKHNNFGTNALGPKVSVPTYAAMTYLLDGTASEGPLADVSGTQMGYKFTKDGTEIIAAWDYKTTSKYSVPKDAKVCDWMGNCSKAFQQTVTLSGAPVYFILGKSS